SWHAGLIGKQLIEHFCRIPVEVAYASEFRYSDAVIGKGDVVIAISQSGETADTMAAIELAKNHGAFIFGIVNAVGSSIARMSDSGTYIHVGPEIGVASTKAFTGQITVLVMLALSLGMAKANLHGVDMFAKVQDVVSYLLLGSMLLMGILGMTKLGSGAIIHQPSVMNVSPLNVVSMTAVAFWLFIGAEYAIPISKNVKNAKRNVPLGMFIGLGVICIIQAIMVLGFHNYTSWRDLASSAAPHLLYGMAVLGKPGQIWMTFVSALAVVSTQNSTVQGLSSIFSGMAKTNLMPQFFGKMNRHRVNAIGIWFITITIMGCAYISQDSSERISFLILVGSVFWMVSYIVAHIDLLVFRYRLPKAPRNFKVPFGPILPCIGIAGTIFMIVNISTDPVERWNILLVTGITLLILFVYSLFWIHFKMKIPAFKPLPMEKVLAMENEMYYKIRKNRGLWK
ncbi:MAG: amino acid permease, partial [Lachnospiraceae bacterium]|nr:amino acid permease [Lachnospiraceae bacterium]